MYPFVYFWLWVTSIEFVYLNFIISEKLQLKELTLDILLYEVKTKHARVRPVI